MRGGVAIKPKGHFDTFIKTKADDRIPIARSTYQVRIRSYSSTLSIIVCVFLSMYSTTDEQPCKSI